MNALVRLTLTAVVVAAAPLLTSCAGTQAVLRPDWRAEERPPNYEDHADGWLFGLIGRDERFDLRRICLDQTPVGVRQGLTATDALLTAVTLGIYAPVTIKVWCGP